MGTPLPQPGSTGGTGSHSWRRFPAHGPSNCWFRAEDLQVLHRLAAFEDAQAYLSGELLTRNVVSALMPYLNTAWTSAFT
ncbi:hypothetical protein [Micromonospora sp. MH33]|uniref:hypothetical protein n=1 Tax=Micromonospora sp. MH33 TaxID=1945509 RepID=UPI001AEF7547|nr:hypothetical protein [Micromonospora sp. MH33]